MEKISVAIVEDSEVVRLMLQQTIRKSKNFTCDQAYITAEDALKFLPKFLVDIVLMDIHLPGINGIDCVKILKNKMPGTQFIMCTTSNVFIH